MKRVLIFGGATEGRLLAEALAGWPVEVTVCVATDYGRQMLHGLPDTVHVHVGRMQAQEMADMMRAPWLCAMDATHPYAVAASENIRAACDASGIRYLRLARPESLDAGEARSVATLADAIALLAVEAGNILATTGVKELDAYTALTDYARRVYTRVLPTVSSIARCEALGFPGSHIIAMQGPFSQALNEAMIRQLDIRWLVTKDGGDLGGFMAKVDAARTCGIQAIVIGRPTQAGGLTMEQALYTLATILEESK